MARTEGQWKKGTTSVTPTADLPILLQNDYLNFGGANAGDLGYGLRNNNGVIEFKNDSGTWQAVGTGGASSLTWNFLAATWSIEPTFNTNITGGSVYNYTLDGTTRYRFVPSPYDAGLDAFYSNFSNPTLTGLIVTRG